MGNTLGAPAAEGPGTPDATLGLLPGHGQEPLIQAERSFAPAKQWRALATRYDKLAITCRAAVVLSACITWTRT